MLSLPLSLPSSSEGTNLRGGMRCHGGKGRKDGCQRTNKILMQWLHWVECWRANKILKVVAALGRVHAWQDNDLSQWIQVLTNVHIVQLDWPLHKVSTLISSNPRDESGKHEASFVDSDSENSDLNSQLGGSVNIMQIDTPFNNLPSNYDADSPPHIELNLPGANPVEEEMEEPICESR